MMSVCRNQDKTCLDLDLTDPEKGCSQGTVMGPWCVTVTAGRPDDDLIKALVIELSATEDQDIWVTTFPRFTTTDLAQGRHKEKTRIPGSWLIVIAVGFTLMLFAVVVLRRVKDRARCRKIVTVVLIQVVVTLVLCELLLRWTPFDDRLLQPLLYRQVSDLDVHTVSDNPRLLYTLKPGASSLIQRGGFKRVSINSFGFRDRERSAEKTKGVFRIVVFGGSNAYGAAVNDGEAYPRQLEQLLNHHLSGVSGWKFEVWNAGHCGYVLAQEVEIARFILAAVDPDLLIFGPTNPGRRAFLGGDDSFARYFEANPMLYRENLVFLPQFDSDAGHAFFLHSALWRTLIIAANHFVADFDRRRDEFSINIVPFIDFHMESWMEVPMVFMPAVPDELRNFEPIEAIRLFHARNLPGRSMPDATYFETHPPVHVYKWYARVMMEELLARGYLPAKPPEPR